MEPMSRAESRGDGNADTAALGWDRLHRPSAWKEAGGSTYHRLTGDTLEGSNPKRAAVAGDGWESGDDDAARGSNPLERHDLHQEGAASVAKGSFTAPGGSSGGLMGDRKSQEGKTGPNGASFPGGEQALKGEPHECCDSPGRGWSEVDRGARRQRRANVKGAKSRGWQPGAGTARGAANDAASWLATGRSDRPSSAEGERNPMRGGCASWTRAPFAEHPAERSRGLWRRQARQDAGIADAPTATGHALKRMVSEESWKNRRIRAIARVLARPSRPNEARRFAARRTHEAGGATRKLWTSA
jgi:hypothetical protein